MQDFFYFLFYYKVDNLMKHANKSASALVTKLICEEATLLTLSNLKDSILLFNQT